MDNVPCKHARTRLIAQDNDAEYVECLDCGMILEAEERKSGAEFNESLADA
jgi:transcription initiation factor TFIIIB Brf1 subunit/transcription initiation factor TFIIB